MGAKESTEDREQCPYCQQRYSAANRIYEQHLERCHMEAQTYKHVKLREALKKWKVPWQHGSVAFPISRETVVQDSLSLLQSLTPEQLRAEFKIDFVGEIVSDAGGAVKEWLSCVNSALLTSDMGLYCLTETDNVSYRFRACLPDTCVCYAWLHGLILAKALLEGVPLNCPLTLVLFKQILGHKLDIEDLNLLNNNLYRGLKHMHENDITGVFFQSFTAENDSVELCPGGLEISVTEANKAEYISQRAEWELVGSTATTVHALLEGFQAIVPSSLLQGITPVELELAICGISTIDLEEWRSSTEYRGEFHDSHEVIRWFWMALKEFSHEELALLLKFVMGTSRLPLEGFKGLRTLRGESARFTLEPVLYTDIRQFPRAHTCFNRLDLPLYRSRDVLKDNLLYVVKHHSVGFGLD